jgi:Fe-S cluster assembly protein SufB
MLEFRLKAFRYWKEQTEPTWGHVHVPPIDYQAISYYADPTAAKSQKPNANGKEIDPELAKTFDKLGIPLEERLALSGNTAVDAIMDSVSVKTTFKEKLREKGVIFCSIGEAIKEHGDLVRQYLGTVVPYRDNFFAALNSAVFSDGSFVYIPKGVRCPMELSSYFRINARNTGQFERTLIVADDDSYVSYLDSIGSSDIMHTIYDQPDVISESFTELDAYYIGLTSYSYDVQSYGLGMSPHLR